jgi:hypothetical protein
MKNYSTPKQLALGLVLGATLVTAIGAMVSGSPTVGRFQLGTDKSQALIIDTVTGQVWNQQDAEFSKPKLEVKKIVNF